MANHYQILDIDTDADTATVKSAYRKLSRRYHPDMTGDTKGHFFVMLNEAYETLSDEDLRREYDLSLNNGGESSSSSQYEPQGDDESKPQQTTYYEPDEIPLPVVEWETMEWFNQDYSDTKEKIVVSHPGRTKGVIGGTVFVLGMLVLGLFSLFVPVWWILPVSAVLAVMTVHRWSLYLNFTTGKLPFLGFAGLFGVSFAYGMLFGANGIPENALTSTALTLLLSFGLFVAAGLWGAKHWRHWDIIKGDRGNITMTAKNIREFISWGTPGELDDATDKFGNRNVALGTAGEKFTADLMEKLLKIPGTRFFHGLKFPGSETADVDHAVINGNKIMLVDSKMWSGGHYSWGANGMIVKNHGSTGTELHTNFPTAVSKYSKDLYEADVLGMILIHSHNGRKVTVDNEHAPGNGLTLIASADDAFNNIGNWFASGNKGIINRGLMNALLHRLK